MTENIRNMSLRKCRLPTIALKRVKLGLVFNGREALKKKIPKELINFYPYLHVRMDFSNLGYFWPNGVAEKLEE